MLVDFQIEEVIINALFDNIMIGVSKRVVFSLSWNLKARNYERVLSKQLSKERDVL